MATIVKRRAAAAILHAPAQRVHRPRPTSEAPPPTKAELLALIHKHIVDLRQTSEITDLSERTLTIYHRGGKMPAPDIRLGGSPLWFRETITEWHATRTKKPQRR